MKQSDLLVMELMVEGLLARPETPEELKVEVEAAKSDLKNVLDKYSDTETGKAALALALALAFMSFLRKIVEITENMQD